MPKPDLHVDHICAIRSTPPSGTTLSYHSIGQSSSVDFLNAVGAYLVSVDDLLDACLNNSQHTPDARPTHHCFSMLIDSSNIDGATSKILTNLQQFSQGCTLSMVRNIMLIYCWGITKFIRSKT